MYGGTLTLEEYMRGKKPDFKPEPAYFLDGDHISCFAKNPVFHAESLSPYLTIYRDDFTGEVIGASIGGVLRAMGLQKQIELVSIR